MNMNQKTQTKIESGMVSVPSEMLKTILEELRSLRNEVMFLFPQEGLEDYSNPARIKTSYQKATKQYTPTALWK